VVDAEAIRLMATILGRVMAYQRPFRARVAREGLLAVAPVSVAYVLVTLVVSALWRDPGAGYRVVAACCAWRATDLARGDLVPLLGSALLVRRPVEAVWTVAAAWLLLGPLEAMVGGRGLLLVGAVGQVVSTVVIDLCLLAGSRAGGSLDGLDVGTSAVVVTVAATLAVATRSSSLAAALGTGLAVDLATTPSLASVEHLVAAVIGVAGAWVLRPALPTAALSDAACRRPRRTGPEEAP
jgi:hypothetical protein